MSVHPPAAPAHTRQERVIAAPPDEVFALIADVSRWPDWQPDVTRVRVEGPLSVGSVFRWRSGVPITSTVTALDAPREIAWTGRTIGTRAVHTWELRSVEAGTLVTTEESMTGWLPRLMTRTTQRTLEQGVAGVLDALEKAVAR